MVGGIRGLITIVVLADIERLVRRDTGRGHRAGGLLRPNGRHEHSS